MALAETAGMRKNRLRLRRRARGYNLIEILVVLAIIGLLVSVAAPRAIDQWNESRKKTTLLNAQGLRLGVNLWKLRGLDGCPSPAALIAARLVERGASPEDPWGTTFEISCDDDGVTVTSAGPDRRRGTEDDIIAPPETRTAQGRTSAPLPEFPARRRRSHAFRRRR
jgi:prepilin-type N-terminal cleavage/methylation domain-containing protein